MHTFPHRISGWNWKTAGFSASARAALFAFAALHSGRGAALKAMCAELALAAVLAGFLGAITQSLRRLEPAWLATLACATTTALIYHPSELLVHTLLGTPQTRLGIALSALFTICATQVSLVLMRRGIFVTGADGQTLDRDFRAIGNLWHKTTT